MTEQNDTTEHVEPTVTSGETEPSEATVETSPSLLEVTEQAKVWLTELFENIDISGVRIETKIEEEEKSVAMAVYSNPLNNEKLLTILRSQKGGSRAIESIQTILHAFFERLYGSRVSVFLDIDDHLKTRTDRIATVATDLADLSTSLGRSLTVAGLSSYDRRVVHNTLQHNSNVVTSSVGQGSFRKLCIEPTKGSK